MLAADPVECRVEDGLQVTRLGVGPGVPGEDRERASLSARLSVFESIYSVERLTDTEAYVALRDRLDDLDDGSS